MFVTTVETEPGIQLSMTLLQRKPAQPLIVYLSDHALAEEPLNRLAEQGSVRAVALRGFSAPAPGKANYVGADATNAFLSLHLNRPLLGQRVLDALAVLPADATVHLIGVGEAGPVALHVAALDPRVTQVTLEGSLLSWTNVVNTPLSYGQLSNVVPGVLKVYDLPELAATLAPRPLTIRNPVDAALQPVSQAVLETTYAACRAAYARQNAAEKLQLQGAR
jgi:hypothetical protein